MTVSTSGRARVTQLARFPVKACGPELLEECDVAVDGLRNDRLLGVVVEDRVVTQREHPGLARVMPVLDDVAATLALRVPGMEPVIDHATTDGPVRDVALFGRPVGVVEQSGLLSAWFSELLGRTATLVAAPASTRRTTPGAVPGETLLSDIGSLSVLSQASVRLLQERLAAEGLPPVPADRFRANLLLDGCGAHAEDHAERIEVGQVELGVAEPQGRCVVVTVDQQMGRRAGPEPLRTLARYRRGAAGTEFGVYAVALASGTIRLGDPVRLVGALQVHA
jgi:uncharacterized protein